MKGLLTCPYFTNQHFYPIRGVGKTNIQLFLLIKGDCFGHFIYSSCQSGRFVQLCSQRDTLGLRGIQTVESIHNNTRIHTCTQPISNRAVLVWEEQEGGKAPSCTTCFSRVKTRRQLSGYFRKLFADNYDKQPHQIQWTACKKTLYHIF